MAVVVFFTTSLSSPFNDTPKSTLHAFENLTISENLELAMDGDKRVIQTLFANP